MRVYLVNSNFPNLEYYILTTCSFYDQSVSQTVEFETKPNTRVNNKSTDSISYTHLLTILGNLFENIIF